MTNSKLNEIFMLFQSYNCNELYNYDLSANYFDVVSCMNLVFENGQNNAILGCEGFIYISNEIIKVIWDKIKTNQILTSDEAKLFLLALYNYSIILMGLNNEFIKFEFLNEKDPRIKNCFGKHFSPNKPGDKHTIYFNESLIRIIADPTLELGRKILQLNTISHELQHAVQYACAIRNVFSLNAYVCSLEQVFRMLDRSFYHNNYHYTMLESDANCEGNFALLSFLLKNKLIDNKTANKLFSAFMNYKNQKEDLSFNHCLPNDKNGDKMGHTILKSISKFLKQNTNLIKEYKLLSLSFNDDGSLMSIDELFKKRLELINQYPDKVEDIDNIYKYIFSYYFNDKVDELDNICRIYRYCERHADDLFGKQILKTILEQKGAKSDDVLKFVNQLN